MMAPSVGGASCATQIEGTSQSNWASFQVQGGIRIGPIAIYNTGNDENILVRLFPVRYLSTILADLF